MNCRPNDVARVIAPGRLTRCPSCGTQMVAVKPDTFVRVVQHDGIAWELEEPIDGTVSFPCGAFLQFRCRFLADEILRPIRNPGDDEQDEMVKLVGPAPMTAVELLRPEVQRAGS